MKLEIKKNLIGVLALVGLIWLIYLINIPLGVTAWDFRNWGLQPRTTSGLVGVFTMPFLHRDMNHILSNTVPLTVLLFMLRASRRTPWCILVSLVVGSGVLLWCFGRSQIHVGASVLIYSLAAYLIAAGIYERKPIAIIVSVLVAVMYGACSGDCCRRLVNPCRGKATCSEPSSAACLLTLRCDDGMTLRSRWSRRLWK